MDIEGFADPRRTNPDQIAMRAGLYRCLDAALARSGVPWEACYQEDRGDGALILVPPDIPKALLVTRFPQELSAALRSHNDAHDATSRLRAHSASEQLASDLAALDQKQWQEQVRTAQGRVVPAADVPWMRAREVFVHTVDLDTGLGFADLPEDFMRSLIDDILAKRGMDTAPDGPLPDVAAYLAGRPHTLTGVPELGPWL